MTLPVTLSVYIARQFAGFVFGMLLALSGLVAMFDFIELLRRSISKPDATFAIVAQIAGLRLPYIAMQVLPFAVLLGGMSVLLASDAVVGACRRPGSRCVRVGVSRSSNRLCTAVRALATTAISPLSSVMFPRAEATMTFTSRAAEGRWH